MLAAMQAQSVSKCEDERVIVCMCRNVVNGGDDAQVGQQ
jgi:hypothetical protein